MEDGKPLDDRQTEILRDAVKALVPWLQRENERLRAENAAMREIVEAVTDQFTGVMGFVRDAVLCYDDNAGMLECPWCTGHEGETAGKQMLFHHTPDCPVTKARALLGQWQQEQGDE